MKWLRTLLLSSVICGFAHAEDMPLNKSEYSSLGKTYNLLFELNDKPVVYNTTKDSGLDYVNNMVNTCEKYKATCHIEVVVHHNAFPIVAKNGTIKPILLQFGVNYNYNDMINNLMKHGVKFTTSRSSIEEYKVSEKDLIPGVIVTDSSTLYLADKAKQGYFIIYD